MSPPIAPPIVVATGDDCEFYRTIDDAVRSAPPSDARVFDAEGRRLIAEDGGLRLASDADGADDLAQLLREWLKHMDALRESTADWTLALLVRASVDHLGYTS